MTYKSWAVLCLKSFIQNILFWKKIVCSATGKWQLSNASLIEAREHIWMSCFWHMLSSSGIVFSPKLRNFNISFLGCIDNCERYKTLFRIRIFYSRFNMGISLTNISFSGGYKYPNAFSSLAIASVLWFLGHLFVEIRRRYE